MRIGVDASCWVNGRGYGRFTRELLRVMVAGSPGDEFICFADARTADRFDIDAPNVRVVRLGVATSPTEAAAADGFRSPRDLLRFTSAVWHERPDVFLSPSVYTYFPVPPRIPVVVAIHDAIPERFPELTLPSRRARLFWWGKVRLALAQARIVLTVSRYAAEQLQTVLGVDRERIRIVQEAPSPAFAPAPAGEALAAAREAGVPEGEPWFTYVGGFNPHKRVDSMVRALGRMIADGGPPAHLLLIGSLTDDVFHDNVAQIREAIEASGVAGLVHWMGFVPDDTLRRLHAGATAVLLVSAAEGFGLPAVEAAACGTPAIATLESPLPEILAGGGIFVEPGNEAAIAAAMRRLLESPAIRHTMGQAAQLAASELRWEEGARVAMEALHEACGGGVALAT